MAGLLGGGGRLLQALLGAMPAPDRQPEQQEADPGRCRKCGMQQPEAGCIHRRQQTADPAHLVKRVVDKSGGLEFGFTLSGNQHTQRE